MEFKDVTIQAMQNMNEEAVMAVAIKSFLAIPPLEVQQKVLDAGEMYKADFEIVRKHIKYDFTNFVVTYPYINEQEDPLYSAGVFSNIQSDFFPMNNYFISVRADVVVMPYGIVEVTFIGEHVFRNTNDFRHYKAHTTFEIKEYFYYEFGDEDNDGEFVQVKEEDLNNGRKLKLKNESTYLQKTKKHVQEYIKREELLEYTKQRLKSRARKYQERFRTFKEYWSLTSNFNSFEKIGRFFNSYIKFLEELETGLQLKLIYSKLSSREYAKLEKMRKKLLEEDISNCEETLKRLHAAIIANKEKRHYKFEDINEFNLNSLHVEDIAIFDEFRAEKVTRLVEFITPRAIDFSADSILQGYIGYDLSLKELYPNLAHMEKREMRTDKMFSDLLERERTQKILDRLAEDVLKKQKKTEEEKSSLVVDGWFTQEELDEILQLDVTKKLVRVKTRQKQLGKKDTEAMVKWEELKVMKKKEES
ncbi:TPA: hypothetical protein ACGPJZ_002170 [Streptococcus agalactiae]